MHAYGVAVNDEEEANSILRALKKEGWKAARQGIGCYSDSDDIDKTWKEYFVYLKGTDTCVGSRCGSLIEASKTKKKKTVDEKTSQTDHYFPEKVVANGKTYELKYHLMMW